MRFIHRFYFLQKDHLYTVFQSLLQTVALPLLTVHLLVDAVFFQLSLKFNCTIANIFVSVSAGQEALLEFSTCLSLQLCYVFVPVTFYFEL